MVAAPFPSKLACRDTHDHLSSPMSTSPLLGQIFFEHTCCWSIFRADNSSVRFCVTRNICTRHSICLATVSQAKNEFSKLLASHTKLTSLTFSNPATRWHPTSPLLAPQCTATPIAYHQTNLQSQRLSSTIWKDWTYLAHWAALVIIPTCGPLNLMEVIDLVEIITIPLQIRYLTITPFHTYRISKLSWPSTQFSQRPT